jgi:hypothetical protein
VSVNLLNTLKCQNRIFIKNSFKKYKGVPAIKINDENTFIEKIKEHIFENKYFLFLSDSASIINKLYHDCFDKERKNEFFIYIDGNKTDIINDASIQLKNKFVFASPSIERGLDFSIDNSQGLFQQTTRTRNINKLYYYGEVKNHRSKYDSLDDVNDLFLNNIKQNNILNNICLNIIEDDQIKMSNNTFFKLFCYNEYKTDVLNTNIIAHYEEQLLNNCFVLSIEGNKQKINCIRQQEINNRVLKINDELFNEYINNIEVRNNVIYNKLNERIKLLNLPKNNTNILIKYKEYITDPYKLIDHYNTMRLFKSDKYIEKKFLESVNNNFDCKTINNVYNKIKIIKTIKNKYNINNFNTYIYDINQITYDEYKLIKTLFRISSTKPANNYELIQMYVTMIKNERIYIYSYNDEYINFHKKLTSYYIPNNEFNNTIILKKIKININLDEISEIIKNGKIFIKKYYDLKNKYLLINDYNYNTKKYNIYY